MSEEEEKRRAAVEAIARAMTTDMRQAQPGTLPLPEVPSAHAGSMFNMFRDQHSDGRAQSLDFYVQPKTSPHGMPSGINGAGLVYRRTF